MISLAAERQLRNLGLNSYEVKIWAALLSRGTSTAGELSNISNVPRSRSYDILESLEKKGFVRTKKNKPIIYIAVSPKEVVERVKKDVESNTTTEIKELNDLRDSNIIEELAILHNHGTEQVGLSELSGSLKGRHNLYNHMEYMMKKAEKSVIITTTENEFVAIIERFSTLFQKLKEKKIKVKILTKINKKTKPYADQISSFVEVANTEKKARFFIIDGKEILFMILNDEEVHPSYDVGIWTNTPLVKILEKLVISI